MIKTQVEKHGVTLEDLLEAKERRGRRQQDWLARYQQPVISLTLVTPGPVKDNIRYRNCMAVALQACDQLLWQRRWHVLNRQVLWMPTGAEALWAVAHPASELKALMVNLEQSHLLGRLWDVDVICPEQGPVGRHALALAGRSCLVCDEPAHVCARAQNHPLVEVTQRVEELLDGWFARD
ncbi:citrate lyase holo-[acyl-carrier protein] synthase [Buttiauxella sp. A2-C2_NF]|uniref:citrate lyase holo-[acyl-carrier protein] synthase n=1 Tax=Buttiauxella TaxID=82976 RepID=UPI00105F4F5B|nr:MULTISPECIES: citrate lyase holo-[acyl-carrier protein] synthase [Buttiauxella]MCE0826127.1 citrate lyase holo-[acyl-carrier protein] synthase [Buttiauxella ferragutiae]TDN52267.1 holo-ACP synthase [Buttiauxella sp. JUb87]UNK59918.1 citrate lyase holo-[acyl-carrier protein] synthase [Buttiauxella ferragutiae]